MSTTSERPTLALRIGITGHRWREAHHRDDERLDPANASAVRASLQRVLECIRTVTTSVHTAHGELFSTHTPILSLVSALAEGADELAAEAALAPESGFVLDVVAPYDLATYATRCAPGTKIRSLWDRARARLILDGAPLADEPRGDTMSARDEQSLSETNRRLVWNSDLIIAVWDGYPARGEAGTANVIERARAEGLPVVHIHSVDPSQVRVLDAAGSDLREPDAWKAIGEVVERLLMPPEPPRVEGHAAQAGASRIKAIQRAIREYSAESPPGIIIRHLAVRVYQLAQFVLTGHGSLQALAATSADITPPWHTIDTAHLMSARRHAVIDPAFQRADYFATAYGLRHRSTFTTIAFFAPFAVVCAWFGSSAAESLKLPYALTELLLLSVLVLFYARSRMLRFHQKWLDYRLLAERIRHLGFLWPLGRSSPVIRVPTHALYTDPRPGWVNWWYRTVAREAGLASVELDPPTVRALAKQIELALVDAQLRYNRHANHIAHRAEHRLHFVPWIPLSLALVAALLHVLEQLHLLHMSESVAHALTSVSIIGPAVGAALHGFASQAGFQEASIRTDASAQQLERFQQRLTAIDLGAPLASQALGDLALSVADVLGEDLAGWQVDYLSRPVNPPG